MTYKPEIDGLRAIAVLLVLFCHMQLGVPGGFIGVDVFFVISGYLITTIIYNEMLQKRFSFLVFYGKRFARLYPALIVAVALTFVAGLLLADPVYLKNLARTARYAITSTANIYYDQHTGYFDFSAQKQPFLHTWSLGVEWQFYLLWPLIMWSILKVTKKPVALIGILLLIFIVSLLGSQWALTHSPNAAYYQMHYRAFELATGGLLVFIYKKDLGEKASIGLMLVGLAAILYASFMFNSKTDFPGFAALLPVLGASACMFAGKGFSKGNFLRHPSVVFIGQASYSIYLIHWPLLVFFKYYTYEEVTLLQKIALVVISVVLGALLYLAVEKRVNWRKMKSKVKSCSILVVLTISLMSLFMYTNKPADGMPWRIAYKELMNDEYLDAGYKNYTFIEPLGDSEGKRIALLTGDSYAGSMATGVDRALTGSGEYIQMMFYPACMISEIDDSPDITQGCRELSSNALKLVRDEQIPLILVESWGTSVILEERGLFSLSKYTTSESFLKFIESNLDDIRSKIGGQPLILVSSVPYREWGESDLECMSRPVLGSSGCLPRLHDYSYKESPIAPYNAFLKEYAQTHDNVYYVESALGTCPNGICTASENAKLYYDGFHTSVYGSKAVAAELMIVLREVLAPTAP